MSDCSRCDAFETALQMRAEENNHLRRNLEEERAARVAAEIRASLYFDEATRLRKFIAFTEAQRCEGYIGSGIA